MASPTADATPHAIVARTRRVWLGLERGWQASLLGVLVVAVVLAL